MKSKLAAVDKFKGYLDYIDGISSSGDRIEYSKDGTCKVKLK